MIGLARAIQRVFAIVGKELVEIVRRPGAIVSLVLGPFLILAVFGLGYDGVRRPLDTVVVVPPTSGLPTDVASYQDLAGGGLRITRVVTDRAAADADLAAQRIDVVVAIPPDPEERLRAGDQSTIDVVVNVVDPLMANYAGFLAAGLSNAVNHEIIRRAVSDSGAYALAAGEPDLAPIPPDVIAAPTRSELVNIAPSTPNVVAFYGPAVLALILQHLAATLIALSLVRERTSGMMELFRVAPVRPAELLAGKLVAFAIIGAGIAAITIALLIRVFAVPLLADPMSLAAVVGLLILAALGLGLFLAVVSDSERQAVQLSLLLLLASVFFSGFVLSVQEFAAPVRALAYALPVTHGIRLISDLMLRGGTTAGWEAAALGAIAAVTLLLAWLLLRRSMRHA